jgi:hypothetical protein
MSADLFNGAFDDLALDAPVANNNNQQKNTSFRSPDSSLTTRSSTARPIVFDPEDNVPKQSQRSFSGRINDRDDHSSDEDTSSDESQKRQSHVRYPSVEHDEDDYRSNKLSSPSLYTAALQTDYHGNRGGDSVSKTLTIQITGVAQITVKDQRTTLFTVLINAREEKLDLIDAKQQLVAYIQKSPIALHPRYKLRLPNGFRVGKCTRRFKPSTERKFNYRKSDTREMLKMFGPFGDYKITKNLTQRVGSLVATEEHGVYAVEVNAHPIDVFHIIALCLIGVLDHMSTIA